MAEEANNTNDWASLLDNLETKRASIYEMGGAEKLAKHNSEGCLDARQRIKELLDPGSFRELGTFVGSVSRGVQPLVPADGLIGGMGAIDGRPVIVGSEDFTVMGGSIGLGTHAKRLRLAQLATQERVPLVMLLEGAGERTTNMLERYPYAPNDLQVLANLSGLVPTVCVVMGSSAGHGALTGMLMDLVIMVQGSAIFSAGPPLVEAAIGERATKEELGGVDVHAKESGVVHNVARDDKSALELVRRYLSYFPTNAWALPPRIENIEEGERSLDEILEIIPPDPRKSFDMRQLVETIADRGSVLELQPLFGESIITALSRLEGRSVAIVANQSLVRSGTIDSDAANKAAHFLEVADAFHLPVVFLTDNPGIMAGVAAERSGALRSAARMYAAQAKVRSPKLHITVRKAYGFGSSLMVMNPFDSQTISLAFPSATLGAMPAGGGGAASHADSDTQSALSAAELGGAWDAVDAMNYDEMIDPRELRNYLLSALEMASGRETKMVEPRPGGVRP